MDIYKVLKKQKKSYIRFMLFMGFIFLLLPAIVYITKRFNAFFITYLVIVEILILAVMISRYYDEYLKYEDDDDKLIISIAGGKIKYRIFRDKIAIVHTIANDRYFDIMIITKSKVRNKKLRILTPKILNKYPSVEKQYRKVKMPDEGEYYYFIIRRGGAKKYLLLEYLFTNCLDAIFTDEAIKNIKEYRKSNKVKHL